MYNVKQSDIQWLYNLLDNLNMNGVWLSDFYLVKKTGDRELTVVEIYDKDNYDILLQVAKKANVTIKGE